MLVYDISFNCYSYHLNLEFWVLFFHCFLFCPLLKKNSHQKPMCTDRNVENTLTQAVTSTAAFSNMFLLCAVGCWLDWIVSPNTNQVVFVLLPITVSCFPPCCRRLSRAVMEPMTVLDEMDDLRQWGICPCMLRTSTVISKAYFPKSGKHIDSCDSACRTCILKCQWECCQSC